MVPEGELNEPTLLASPIGEPFSSFAIIHINSLKQVYFQHHPLIYLKFHVF